MHARRAVLLLPHQANHVTEIYYNVLKIFSLIYTFCENFAMAILF